MDPKKISQELKELCDILAEAKKKLANIIPYLVDNDNVDCYRSSLATISISDLSLYFKNLKAIAEELDKQPDQ